MPGIRLADAQDIRSVWEQIEQVATYAENEEANWLPITAETVIEAQTLIARVHELVYAGGLVWQVPHVGSDGDGAISFEWWRRNQTLTLYAYADGSTESLLAWGADVFSAMESAENLTDEQIVSVWRRFTEPA